MEVASYIVKRGTKYLHMNTADGITWGSKANAFHFYSTEAATQIACALTSSRATISIVLCEGE